MAPTQRRIRRIRRKPALLAATALAAAALAAPLAVAQASGTEPGAEPAGPRIHDIQGSTRLSPYAGQQVTDVPGIVTGVRGYGSRGFWMQDQAGDGDDATSEGVFVFTNAAPEVAVGDEVLVSGRVGEYYYGGQGAGGQSVTQLSAPAVRVVSAGNALPAPYALSARTLPEAYAPGGDLEALELRPARYALDRYESLEGMTVEIGAAPVTGPSTAYHELWVNVGRGGPRTPSGGALYSSYAAQNGGRLKVESLVPVGETPFPVANVGDRLDGPVAGPLDYDEFGGYVLAARQALTVTAGGLAPEATRPQRQDELAVAAYNVENLHAGDDQAKIDRLAAGVVDALASPDVVALEEIQDNSGATDDGTVAAGETLSRFTDAIVAAGGPAYEWRGIDPLDGQDGGQPGGNIRNVFLFNPERVAFVDRPGGDATTATEVVRRDGEATLSHSPGRIDPGNAAAWTDSRKPLAGEFRFRGETVIVVANHFASKGGDQPLHGVAQPPERGSETQRLAQAEAVNAFVRQARSADRQARVVVLGDINDFEFSGTTEALTAGGALRSTAFALPRPERYTYVFQGNAQVLDQTLVTPAIRRFDYDIVHINAEFADQASDHDPQVLRLRP